MAVVTKGFPKEKGLIWPHVLIQTLLQGRESNLVYHLSNCTVSLQEQALSLPVGGGDTLQVLLNSQGSDSPFLIHLQAPFHSREETWPFS